MGQTYLFVIDSFGAGGAERSLLELIPLLSNRGVSATVACLYRSRVGFEEEAREAGLRVEVLPGRGLPAKVLSLRRLVRNLEPDLIYTSLFNADLVGRIAAIRLGVPVVVNLVNTSYDAARLADPNVKAWRLRFLKSIDGFLARHLTDHFHAISEAVKVSAVESFRVSPERITVVRRGRDLDRIGERTPERRAAMRASLGLDESAEVLVTVGRQEYQKGHVHLIDALPAVIAARPNVHLLLVGREGHFSAAIQERIATLGLDERVTLLGHRGDVTDVMAAADLFVFPSLYEGLGGALIEAIGLGLPAVVSDLPALREVVEAGGSGDVVPPGDSLSLAKAISALLADEPRRDRYSVRAREIFEERFRSEVVVERLADLLASVASGAQSTRDS